MKMSLVTWNTLCLPRDTFPDIVVKICHYLRVGICALWSFAIDTCPKVVKKNNFYCNHWECICYHVGDTTAVIH